MDLVKDLVPRCYNNTKHDIMYSLATYSYRSHFYCKHYVESPKVNLFEMFCVYFVTAIDCVNVAVCY